MVARRIDHWIFESFALTPRSLGIARILIGSYLVLYRAPELRWIGSLPDPFFRPPAGPFQVIGGIPPSGVITALSIALSIATIALLIGYHTRLASCLTGLLLFAVMGFTYSFGHVHHSGTYLASVLVIMAASNWGGAYSIDALRRRDGSQPVAEAWPVALAALLLGFLMLTSALPKVASGWLVPSTVAVRGHVAHYHFVAPRAGLLGTLPLASTSDLIWKLFDYLTVFFEAGFVIAIVSPRWIRLFCAAAVVFHFGIFLAFGIDFTGSVVAYSIFFEWSTVIDRLHVPRTTAALAKHFSESLSRIRAAVGPAVLLAGAALYLLTVHIGAPMRNLASRVVTNPDQAASLFAFGIALPVALIYIVLRTTSATRHIVRRRSKAARAAQP
jgi:uncharacterized membrane protein YphA (DoxX/SURF4 family)